MNDELLSNIKMILFVVEPLVLFLFRRSLVPIWKWITLLLKRQLSAVSPKSVVWKWADTNIGKCPNCGRVVSYNDPHADDLAFKCESCGEQGTWINNQKP